MASHNSPELRPCPDHFLQPAQPSEAAATFRIATSASLAYALTYFWRYPIFLLPQYIMGATVVTIAGRALDLHACFSFAFILGFGAAKLPAMRLVTSAFFWRNRLCVVLSLLVSSMLASCGGVLLFARWPALQVASVFVGSLGSSCLYGAMVTYLEGRRRTEILLAASAACFVYAGTLSRALAAAVVRLPPELLPHRAMPLAIGLVMCPASCVLMVMVDRAPPPSRADVAARSARSPMPPAKQAAFVGEYFAGLAALLLVYCGFVSLRSFRDFYPEQIFGAALGGAVQPSVYILADLPGALMSCAALVLLSTVRSSRAALRYILLAVLAGLGVAVGSTALFEARAISGLAWLLSYSGAFYAAFGVLGTPYFERLFAATRAEGTCAFLVFLSDLLGYVCTTALLLYQNFGPLSGSSDEEVLRLFTTLLFAAAAPLAVLILLALVYFSVRLRPVETGREGLLQAGSMTPPDELPPVAEEAQVRAQRQRGAD